MAMNVMVIDSNGERGKANARCFLDSNFKINYFNGTTIFEGKNFDLNATETLKYDVMLVHNKNIDWLTDHSDVKIVIRYTGGDSIPLSDEDCNLFWIQRPITESNPLNAEEVNGLQDWLLQKLSGNDTALPHILFKGSKCYILAFYILSIGYLYAHSNITSQYLDNLLNYWGQPDKQCLAAARAKAEQTELTSWWITPFEADRDNIFERIQNDLCRLRMSSDIIPLLQYIYMSRPERIDPTSAIDGRKFVDILSQTCLEISKQLARKM